MNILIKFHARRDWPGLYDESFLHQPLESLSNDHGGNGKDMPENNDLIGWMRKNNNTARAARTLIDYFDVVCQIATWNFQS